MTKEKKVHRASSEMFPMVRNLLGSGQSHRQFCLEQGIPVAVMQYWLRKYRSENAGLRTDGFVAMKVQTSDSVYAGVEIVYADGTRLRLGYETRADQVRQMLPVFQQR
jgi:hypothetical protein